MKKYDVVIIGSGIGGLICGCYLAKGGLKVLIVEQHIQPGGYCSSFKRKGYLFDAGVHYLGSLKKGTLRKVLDELNIDLPITQIDPSDKIIMPDNITHIRANIKDTISEFEKSFPGDKVQINSFFNFICGEDSLDIYVKIKKMTFKQLLDEFFGNYKIKATLTTLLGNIGLYSRNAAAFPSVILYREYLLDSGYYPQGGMQAFANSLLNKFTSYGGDSILGKKVVKIIMGDKIKGVILDNGENVESNTIVSNADATETFKDLLDYRSKELSALNKIEFSSSMFLLYLGLNLNLHEVLKDRSNIWYFTDYNVDEIYSDLSKNAERKKLDFLQFLVSSLHDPSYKYENKSTVTLMVPAPYKNKIFWDNYKEEMSEMMLSKAEEVIKDLKKYIDLKIIATPATLERYTLNRDGSFVGLLATLGQLKCSILPQKSSIEGLYLVGHWCSMGSSGQGGIPSVAYSGRNGARLILEDKGYNWQFKDSYL